MSLQPILLGWKIWELFATTHVLYYTFNFLRFQFTVFLWNYYDFGHKIMGLWYKRARLFGWGMWPYQCGKWCRIPRIFSVWQPSHWDHLPDLRPSPAICLGKHRMIPEIDGSFHVSSKYWKDHSWLHRRFSSSHSSHSSHNLCYHRSYCGTIYRPNSTSWLSFWCHRWDWSHQLLPIDLDSCMIDACRCRVGSLFQDISSSSVIGLSKLLPKTSGFPKKIVGSCKLPSKLFCKNRVQMSNVHHPSNPTTG